MTTNITEIENRFWGAADQLWANSGLVPRALSIFGMEKEKDPPFGGFLL